jgi:hypothetical protein
MNKTDDFTIIVRFKSTGSGMLYSLSHTNPDRAYFDLMIDEEGKVGVIMGDVTCTFDLFTTGTYNDGDWHFIEIEFYGDPTNPTINLYIDGDLDNTTTEWLCPMIDEDFQTAKVGRNSNAETDYLEGEIDDIKIYKSGHWWPEPPYSPTIVGPSKGGAGQTLTFTFNAMDPDDDIVRFHIDWGDGITETTSYVPSGGDKEVSHIWDKVADYTIEAFAEDIWGMCGPSERFTVIIPRDKQEDCDCQKVVSDININSNITICILLIIRFILIAPRAIYWGAVLEFGDPDFMYLLAHWRYPVLSHRLEQIYESDEYYDCGLFNYD